MAANKTRTRKDNFISKIVKDPASPPETILLRGYLGDSSEEGHTRLYLDAQLNNYVEIPNDAILHEEDLPKDQSPLGESYVWIKQDAEIIYGPAAPQRLKSKFFEGPIAQAAGFAPHTPACPSAQCTDVGCTIACPAPPVSAAQACFTGIQCFVTPACRPPFTPVHVCPITQVCPITDDGCPPPLTPRFGCPPPFTPLRGCPLPTQLHLCPSNPLLCPVVTPACPPLPTQFCPPTPVNLCQPTQGCPVLTPACPPTNPIFCPPVSGPNFCFTPACPPTNPIFCPPVSGPNFCFTPACPSVNVIHCPTSPIICQPTPFHGCPPLTGPPGCPIISVQGCPSLAGCPSGPACGPVNPGGGF